MQLSYHKNHAAVSLIVLGALIAIPVRVWVSLPLFSSISLLDFVSACLLIYVIFYTAQKQAVDIGDRWISAALVVPLVMLLISIMWTTDVESTIKQIIIYGEAFVCYIGAIAAIKSRRTGHPDAVIAMIWTFVLVMLLSALCSLLHVPGFDPRIPPKLASDPSQLTNYFNSYYSRLSNPFIGLSNDFGSVLVLFVFPLYAIASCKRSFVAKAIAHLNLLAVLMTQSRGILGALFACLLIYITRHVAKRRMWRLLVVVMVFSAVGSITYFYMNSATSQFFSSRFNLSNIIARENNYLAVTELIAERPLLGLGGGVVPANNPIVAIGIHDAYLEQVLSYGILGGLVTISFLLLVPLRFWYLYKRDRGTKRTLTGAVALSFVAESIVYLSQTSYQASVIRVLIYFSTALLVMLIRSGGNNSEDADALY